MAAAAAMYALSRSGHTMIHKWVGGDVAMKNCENCKVGGPGAVVLREYSSWLASYIVGDSTKLASGHTFEQGAEVGTLKERMLASDVWMDNAKHFLAAENDLGGDLVPISSYHWITSRWYRVGIAAELKKRFGVEVADSPSFDEKVELRLSSWDVGRPANEIAFLQRYRNVFGSTRGEYQGVFAERKDCRELSQEIFRLNFDEEILG